MTKEIPMARLEARIPANVKSRLQKNAAECGLNTTEYLTQLIMGYTPRSFSPDICRLLEAIDHLHNDYPITDAESHARLRALESDIRNTLILPSKGGGD